MREKHKFGVGIVGAGQISQFHIRALQRIPCVKIVGIADVDQSRAREVQERFSLPNVFGSIRALCEAGAEVVHILTPPASHG